MNKYSNEPTIQRDYLNSIDTTSEEYRNMYTTRITMESNEYERSSLSIHSYNVQRPASRLNTPFIHGKTSKIQSPSISEGRDSWKSRFSLSSSNLAASRTKYMNGNIRPSLSNFSPKSTSSLCIQSYEVQTPLDSTEVAILDKYPADHGEAGLQTTRRRNTRFICGVQVSSARLRWLKFWTNSILFYLACYLIVLIIPASSRRYLPTVIIGSTLTVVSACIILVSYTWQRKRLYANQLLMYVAVCDFGFALVALLQVLWFCWPEQSSKTLDSATCAPLPLSISRIITSSQMVLLLASVGWFGAAICNIFISVTNPFANHAKQLRIYHIVVSMIVIMMTIFIPYTFLTEETEKRYLMTKAELYRVVNLVLPVIPASSSIAQQEIRIAQWQQLNILFWGPAFAAIACLVILGQIILVSGWSQSNSGTIIAMKARRRLMRRMTTYVHTLNLIWLLILVAFFIYRSNKNSLMHLTTYENMENGEQETESTKLARTALNVLLTSADSWKIVDTLFPFLLTSKGYFTCVVWFRVNRINRISGLMARTTNHQEGDDEEKQDEREMDALEDSILRGNHSGNEQLPWVCSFPSLVSESQSQANSVQGARQSVQNHQVVSSGSSDESAEEISDNSLINSHFVDDESKYLVESWELLTTPKARDSVTGDASNASHSPQSPRKRESRNILVRSIQSITTSFIASKDIDSAEEQSPLGSNSTGIVNRESQASSTSSWATASEYKQENSLQREIIYYAVCGLTKAVLYAGAKSSTNALFESKPELFPNQQSPMSPTGKTFRGSMTRPNSMTNIPQLTSASISPRRVRMHCRPFEPYSTSFSRRNLYKRESEYKPKEKILPRRKRSATFSPRNLTPNITALTNSDARFSAAGVLRANVKSSPKHKRVLSSEQLGSTFLPTYYPLSRVPFALFEKEIELVRQPTASSSRPMTPYASSPNTIAPTASSPFGSGLPGVIQHQRTGSFTNREGGISFTSLKNAAIKRLSFSSPSLASLDKRSSDSTDCYASSPSLIPSTPNSNRRDPPPPPPSPSPFHDENTVSGKRKLFFDYAPEEFAQLRAAYGITTSSYIKSFRATAKERISAGASGAFMFYSGDNRLIVKSMREKECKTLVEVLLPVYVPYILNNPASRISRFFGCHRLRLYGRSFYFLVMANVLHSDLHTPYILEKYDVKGSWIDRKAKIPKLGDLVTCMTCHTPYTFGNDISESGHVHHPDTIFKDLDFARTLNLPLPIKEQLFNQIVADCEFLKMIGIMDYSLLIGVHKCSNTDIGHMNMLNEDRNTEILNIESGSYQYAGWTGYNLEPLVEAGPCPEEVYFIGIIDILQIWDWEKLIEKYGKIIIGKKSNGISAMAPEQYCQRFQSRVRELLFRGSTFFDSEDLYVTSQKNSLVRNSLTDRGYMHYYGESYDADNHAQDSDEEIEDGEDALVKEIGITF